MFCIKRREAMKKRLIIVAALVACMVVFTLMTGLVQAQSLDPSGVETVEAEGNDTPLDLVQLAMFMSNCSVGPRLGDTFIGCAFVGFGNTVPRNVQCQTRNANTEFINFPDQFACQIIGTSGANGGTVFIKIRRLDIPGAGWGQNLQVNLLVVP
jgi:hypothetical protein